MATFDTIEDVRVFKTYKAKLKTVVGKIRQGAKVSFVYVDRFKFDDKERVLILIDHDEELNKKLGKPPIKGKCTLDKAEKVVFEAASTILFDKVVKLFAEAGIARPVANPKDGQDTPTQVPVGEKLKMSSSWNEIRTWTWDPEAQDLVDAFDGLVGVYRGLPEVPSEWTDLSKEFEKVKGQMSTLVNTKIKNDKTERETKLTEVQTLTKTARKLAEAIRGRAAEEKLRAKSGGTRSTVPQQKQPTPTIKQPTPLETPKPQTLAPKVVDEQERQDHEVNKKKATERRQNLLDRMEDFTMPLHGKHSGEIEKTLQGVLTVISRSAPVDWKKVEKSLDEVAKTLDTLDDLADKFDAWASELDKKRAETRDLVTGAADKLKVAGKTVRERFRDLQKDTEDPSIPELLIETKAYDLAISAHARLNDWLRETFPRASGGGVQDEKAERIKAFVYNKPTTWDLNPVAYLNGTSASAIGKKAADLAIAALASNTTAGGSVLKTDHEGHAHLDGGSGGVAFVYKLDKKDYFVTPTVVDISSKRGGKNGNQYEWKTGGGWAYFPPNAKY